MMNAAHISKTFDAHRRSVYGWAFRILGNHHDALDVTQEVFIKWWRANSEQDAPRGAVGWLRRVTINHSINMVNARRRQRPLVDDDHTDHTDPRAPAERREMAEVVAGAMDTLSEHQRCVLFAKVYDGCTFAEIAGQTGLAIPTVKTHYLRALRAARRALMEAGVGIGDPS